MANNSQARKWALVINNPQECGLDHDAITAILQRFSPDYFCMADEIATTGTYHTHVFLYSPSPIRFSTIKNRFPTAHIEKAYGSSKENREYILKAGKWAGTEKAETAVENSFLEMGRLPAEKEEKAPQMCRLLNSLRDGKTTTEIIDETPNLAFRVRDIDTLRQTLLAERYAAENRVLEVCYLCGATGTGKTRGIYERHNPRDIYRVTNYRAGRGISFDGYAGQDVLVFEEFYSQIPIEDMLNFLDIYPLSLPARYSDKVACYTKVYITSNLSLGKQYREAQWNRPETWRAFLRRIHWLIKYREDGTIEKIKLNKIGGRTDEPK
ncbi:viral replication protein [Anaerotruncus sp. AF02-27]|uniref:viral replication protein n=1 Tax=Anaerotruncus TaxID=244127 RepID=UPI000E4C6B96|nr:viral replication protein [Anaerotruncus sp. AF02-27]RGX54678.1 viral replication protein [Anaerotruncus sp. AF02-27]